MTAALPRLAYQYDLFGIFFMTLTSGVSGALFKALWRRG